MLCPWLPEQGDRSGARPRRDHHAEQHRIGENSFSARFKLDMKSVAEALWKMSKHGVKYRMEHGE